MFNSRELEDFAAKLTLGQYQIKVKQPILEQRFDEHFEDRNDSKQSPT